MRYDTDQGTRVEARPQERTGDSGTESGVAGPRAYPRMGTGSEQVTVFSAMEIGREVPVPISG